MILGTPKYIIGVLLSVSGFIAMYLFGGGIITLFNTAKYVFSGEFVRAFVEYFLVSALPPTSIGQIFIQAIIGACVAGASWFVGMAVFHKKVTF